MKMKQNQFIPAKKAGTMNWKACTNFWDKSIHHFIIKLPGEMRDITMQLFYFDIL